MCCPPKMSIYYPLPPWNCYIAWRQPQLEIRSYQDLVYALYSVFLVWVLKTNTHVSIWTILFNSNNYEFYSFFNIFIVYIWCHRHLTNLLLTHIWDTLYIIQLSIKKHYLNGKNVFQIDESYLSLLFNVYSSIVFNLSGNYFLQCNHDF